MCFPLGTFMYMCMVRICSTIVLCRFGFKARKKKAQAASAMEKVKAETFSSFVFHYFILNLIIHLHVFFSLSKGIRSILPSHTKAKERKCKVYSPYSFLFFFHEGITSMYGWRKELFECIKNGTNANVGIFIFNHFSVSFDLNTRTEIKMI